MNVIASLGLISVFLLLLLSSFLLFNKSPNRVGNVLFAAFLLITCLDISGQVLGDFYRNHGWINKLRLALAFLQMPLLYFYVRRACFSDFKLKPKLIWHSLPFFVFLLIFTFFGIEQKLEIGYVIILQLQYYLYFVAIFLLLRKYRKIHDQFHSLQSATYQWLMTASILLVFSNTIVLLRGGFEAMNDFQRFPELNIAVALMGLLVISWFVLKTMRNPELFTKVNEIKASSRKNTIAEEEQMQHQQEKLHRYMLVNKPYLEEALSLQELSQSTQIPMKRLSLLINQKIGKHFFDYVNAYRIEDAKSLLKETDFTIQQVMYEVGFNSKSSFNTAFKKITSQTPSAFRKQSV
ncbi:Helix-turn-helix domain-containing protein [Marivirga sericea]|uniref:Helix-turn-helix domain-containing protein n=1 Tax=Marivirga sericea TaxID=1028 RepID=A0A1X7IHE0_9BACT|nr:AraC family transcriptional regulator [Marivirga sericea]SMG13717.1 Helix-turn-helix domain-containing protein [Marivirga sericea]